ncbi:peroxynitrite isomerase THAP4-like isoform X1 [Leptopilina boulardi]|uniref:peroxynitrite isomerase THAP4-like isoform X1 n=2 Tax=Leptopilina boulardi TaxID=63433 RepID=UPI0021F6748F|nr:peroxynitrite isomerase THAP4-like isoform X1 [Leptopilina boulardi]XP_051154253.1 peroxynitrite isomerase THAP4-like isoform X1 [Leptopilina boulardi]XP_051154254.1 peroxynitrite isomerase THAP4-like isoform X1 [Leptopilina boulardi]XP_051154255.1 peroxynitrite isomerase THAP4-like isoform X1 [Leptopilina boulardi]
MKQIPGLNFKDFKNVLEKLKELKSITGSKVSKLLNNSEMEALPRHDALKSISWLEGTWSTKSSGKGQFPTISPFEYNEKMSFSSLGQPMFNYKSETWNPETKKPLHLETGFLKIIPNTNKINFLLAHNFGLTTIEEGEVCDKKIILTSLSVERPREGTKPPKVLQTKRELTLVEDNCLEYVFYMSTEKTPELTEHLRTIYHKQ